MSTLSNRFLKLSEKMVSKFGVDSQWTLVKKKSVSTEDDPTSYSEVTESETAVSLAIVSWKESDYDGKTIKVGDKPAIMPAAEGYPVPEVGDVLRSSVDGSTYRIVAPLKIFSVNGITVSYKINLRG